MYTEYYKDVQQVLENRIWVRNKLTSVRQAWENAEVGLCEGTVDIRLIEDDPILLDILINDQDENLIILDGGEPLASDPDDLVQILTVEDDLGISLVEDDRITIFENQNDQEVTEDDQGDILRITDLFSRDEAVIHCNELSQAVDHVEDHLFELANHYKNLVEEYERKLQEINGSYRSRVEAMRTEVDAEDHRHNADKDALDQKFGNLHNQLSRIENTPHWRLMRWLADIFTDRKTKLSGLRQNVNDLEQSLQQESSQHTQISDFLSDTLLQMQQEYDLEKDALVSTARNQQADVINQMRAYYQRALDSITEMQSLLENWLEWLSGQLCSQYPEMTAAWLGGEQARRFLSMEHDCSEGIRVGGLIYPDHRFTIPAVINPLQMRRHVFVSSVGRSQGTSFLKGIILRALLSFQPGMVQFSLIDGLELGQPLTIFTSKLPNEMVGTKVCTLEAEIQAELFEIRKRIYEINQHVLVTDENNIERYNRDHSDIPLPYHFIVISSFPHGLNPQSLGLLREIMNNGQRAGFFVLATQANPEPDLRDFDINDYLSGNYTLNLEMDQLAEWNHEHLSPYAFQCDEPPGDPVIGQILQVVAETYQDRPTAIPYERLIREMPELWSQSTSASMRSLIGLTAGGQIHAFELDDATAHVLIGGRTGSGKTVLIHNIICGLAQAYHPDELEMYLLDFKGSEFNVYAKKNLPHARTIAVDCDVEVGLATLKRLQEEMERRKKLFDQTDVAHYRAYREAGGRLPRILLAIDEIQIMTQILDNRLVTAVENSISDLLRRGRSFGIHILIGTQSPTNVLTAQITQQIAIRICLRADQQVSRLVLGEGNEAASSLQKQGEAIYNSENGNREKNITIRVALLEKDEIAQITQTMVEKAEESGFHRSLELIYFDGKETRRLFDHERIQSSLHKPPSAIPIGISIPLGKSLVQNVDTEVSFKRERYNNLIIVGGEGERPHAITSNMLLGLCATLPIETRFFLIDLTYEDQPFSELSQVFSGMPHEFTSARNSQLGVELVDEVHKKLVARREMAKEGQRHGQLIFLVIYSMENFIDMRGPDPFLKTDPRKKLEEIVKEGPLVGIFTILQTQTLAKKEIISADEFGNRVCFQVAEDDSRALLESDTASKIQRDDRALYRHRTWGPGRVEKFIPYLPPSQNEIEEAAQILNHHQQPSRGEDRFEQA